MSEHLLTLEASSIFDGWGARCSCGWLSFVSINEVPPLIGDARAWTQNLLRERHEAHVRESAGPVPDPSLETLLRDYVDGYEWRDDPNFYVPTDDDRAMIEDAILGFVTVLEQHGMFTLNPAGPVED
jgi:hypothetical protein